MDSSINLVIHDSDAEGLITAHVANWSTQIISIPISRLSEHRKSLQRVGLYVLWGYNQEPPFGRAAYIGEAENVAKRLTPRHDQFKDDSVKWERVIVLIGDELSKGRARWIEARLIEVARNSNTVRLTNRKNKGHPPLASNDKVYSENFLRVALMAIPFLRVTAFDRSATISPTFLSADPQTATTYHQLVTATNNPPEPLSWRERYIHVLRDANGTALTSREIAERCIDAFPEAVREKRETSQQTAIQEGGRAALINQIAAQVSAHGPTYPEFRAVPGSSPRRWILNS